MKKIFVIFTALILASLCILLAACFSSWDGLGEEGNIVINLGNGGARAATGDDIYDIYDEFEITLSGPGEKIISKTLLRGISSAASFAVQPGSWSIVVHAAKEGDLVGYGETNVEVKAGAAVPASVVVENINDKAKPLEPNSWDALVEVFKNNIGRNQVVKIINDIDDADTTLSLAQKKWNITLVADEPVTIKQNGSITGNTGNSLFRVLPGCELTLGKNITIDGGNNGPHSLFVVQNNGKLIMYDSVTITKGEAKVTTLQRGGGVTVDGGTFIMKGGEISGNKAPKGGGVLVLSGTFTKTGGMIYGSNEGSDKKNTATSGQGHAVYGPGTRAINNTLGLTDNL
jgi:hypothetical protein